MNDMRWADVVEAIREEMLGDGSRDRRMLAARILVKIAEGCFGPDNARAVLAETLCDRLASLYPAHIATARQIVAALSSRTVAESLLEDDRGLGLGNPHFEGLAYPKAVPMEARL